LSSSSEKSNCDVTQIMQGMNLKNDEIEFLATELQYIKSRLKEPLVQRRADLHKNDPFEELAEVY